MQAWDEMVQTLPALGQKTLGRPATFAFGALVTCCVSGPSGPEPEPAPPPPLDIGTAEAIITRHASYVTDCYRVHRLNLGLEDPSSYVVRLRIPNDGTAPIAEIREATVEGQEQLEACIIDKLETMRFPVHSGDTMVLDVPIRAPRR